MNKATLTPLSIRMHNDSFCSQVRTPFRCPRTIEEGVEIIKGILKKNVLCRHDVKEINKVYQSIDLLERQIDPIPNECNSQLVLEEIIKKVQGIKNTSDNDNDKKTIEIPPDIGVNLISLFHLQNFSDEDLTISEYFDDLIYKFRNNPKVNEDVATHLPCCYSETQFDKDVESLIGRNRSERVNKILHQKKEKLISYERTKQATEAKKLELKESRKSDSKSCPAFFDELLENGYINLYNHLIQMRALTSRNARRLEIEKMTLSLISRVILETREAVIQKVESSIPAARNNILFLLGGSGVGKSTALCYLRGDKMALEENFHYKSQDEKGGLIGDEGATSCTFLPNIEIVNDLIIIDFPGFDDTCGQLISLGMEFALRSLLNKYHPKILVLEEITNIAGRFAATSQLGLHLRRLLEDKEKCILGITKYSKDPDFGKIRTIEEQQKNLAREETDLIATTKALSEYNLPNLLTIIQKNQDRLREIQQQLQELLPKKAESRKRVQEKEGEILKQIGLKTIMEFNDLEDIKHLSLRLEILSNLPSIRANSHQMLDADDEKLLEILFINSLVTEVESKQNYYTKFKDFKDFEQSVFESSLINALFCQSNPEIGQLLHLPEIDSNIVRKYDKEVVSKCIEKYMGCIISTVNVSFINKVLKEMAIKVPPQRLENLNKKMERLQNYVKGLLGLPGDPKLAEQEWIRIQKEHQADIDDVEKRFELPGWAKIGLCIPAGIPYGIITFVKWNKQSKLDQKMIETTINQCCNDLDQIYETLQRLKVLEKIIQKQDAIDKVFNSMEISLETINEFKISMQNKINKVRDIYGSEDWDKRVSFLADKFLSANLKLKSDLHSFCILFFAYTLIEPNSHAAFEFHRVWNDISAEFTTPQLTHYLEGYRLIELEEDKSLDIFRWDDYRLFLILRGMSEEKQAPSLLNGMKRLAKAGTKFDIIKLSKLPPTARVLRGAAFLKAHKLI